MQGLDATTGAALAGIDHLRQSIRDILTTRIGTRVMRRDYGSDLPGLIDRPMSPGLRVEIFAATARALRRWEPRVRVERIAVANAVPGRLTIELVVRHLPDGRTVTLDGITVE